MMKNGTFEGKTEAQWLEESNRCSREKEESFARSDTDGFLSQWASGLHSDLYYRKAELAKTNGIRDFNWLMEGNRIVGCKTIKTRFGECWMLNDKEANKFGRKFVPMGEKSSVQKGMGLREGLVPLKAWAGIGGSGRGLSGTAYVVVIPHPAEVERIFNS